MPTVAEVQAKVAKTVVNMDRLDLFVNGPVGTIVQTDNGPVDCIATIAQRIVQGGLAGLLDSLPDEARGDTVPSSGYYFSGGVLKRA